MANSAQRNRIQGEQSATFLAFAQDWAVALDVGLQAAAEVYAGAVQRRLSRGYTSGAFVGRDRKSVVDSVRVRRPKTDRTGQRVARVGSNNPITGMWEFGHRNVFTRRFERVEHWRMAIPEAGPDMARAFHDAFAGAL